MPRLRTPWSCIVVGLLSLSEPAVFLHRRSRCRLRSPTLPGCLPRRARSSWWAACGARLSVVVDLPWRAQALAEMIDEAGLEPEITRTEENTPWYVPQ